MVRAWYRAETGDDKEAMMLDPPQFLPVEEVMRKTGIICLKFKAATWDTDGEYAALKESRRYSYEDTVEISKEALPNYDALVKTFATEHIHPDEEVRFVIEGTGYFDIRDWDDRWIRLEARPDDLLILPAGIYHRFVLDKKNFIKVKRLFEGTPCWTAYFRPDGDDQPVRGQYLQRMAEMRLATGQ
ncbi:unnamed protein product [Candidula unifasciata]|uniref:Acireductone dioxygenase n=1 Tax=Candidula unifasciata TaxID=100452 RepID=A0A8S4A4L9_9EUPU|nr:unnamed protein product [Candidula unifasciata]